MKLTKITDKAELKKYGRKIYDEGYKEGLKMESDGDKRNPYKKCYEEYYCWKTGWLNGYNVAYQNSLIPV